MSNTRRIGSFLLMAFGFTWAIAGSAALFGVRAGHSAYTVVAAWCMFGPAVAALVQWRLVERVPWSALRLHPRLIRWRALVITVLLGVLIMPLCLLVVNVLGNGMQWPGFGMVDVSSERFLISLAGIMAESGVKAPADGLGPLAGMPGAILLLLFLAGAVFAAFTVNLPFMLGEELGWRGYLFQATANWAPARRIALTGPVWGLWHAPLIMMGHNYPGYPVLGIGLMVVFCTLLAVLFDHSRVRAQSVWAACVLHGLINGSAGMLVFFAWDGHVLVASPAGAVGFIALALLCIAVFVFDARYRKAFFTNGVEAPAVEQTFAP